jgi:hypothetical protein
MRIIVTALLLLFSLTANAAEGEMGGTSEPPPEESGVMGGTPDATTQTTPQAAPPGSSVYWNAFASYLHAGKGARVYIGYSGIQTSAEDATNAALRDCKARSGKTCKATKAFASGCYFATWGSTKTHIFSQYGASKAQVLQKCRQSGTCSNEVLGGCLPGYKEGE